MTESSEGTHSLSLIGILLKKGNTQGLMDSHGHHSEAFQDKHPEKRSSRAHGNYFSEDSHVRP